MLKAKLLLAFPSGLSPPASRPGALGEVLGSGARCKFAPSHTRGRAAAAGAAAELASVRIGLEALNDFLDDSDVHPGRPQIVVLGAYGFDKGAETVMHRFKFN